MAQQTRTRRHDPRRAKIHHSYTVAEAGALFGVHRNTVRNWIRGGLKTLKAGGCVPILGSELREFLTRQRAERRVRCPPGAMYCLRCRDAREPPDGLVEMVAITPTTVNLRGICPACGALMHRRASLARMGENGFGRLMAHAGG